MRGEDENSGKMFSYVSAERRIPADHPLRAMRQMVDGVLKELSGRFDGLYARVGRPSIAPEKLLRALLIQILYSVRRERLLMEQLDYNLLFRWFVGLEMDDAVWDATVFTKNRERLLEGDIAGAFFEKVIEEAKRRGLLGRIAKTAPARRSRQPDDQLSRREARQPAFCRLEEVDAAKRIIRGALDSEPLTLPWQYRSRKLCRSSRISGTISRVG
jgi:transposase